VIFLGDFSFARIFFKNYRVTMTTTLDTSCSENTMVCQQGEAFCMHVFSSKLIYFWKICGTPCITVLQGEY
jgi:hypothetical protein